MKVIITIDIDGNDVKVSTEQKDETEVKTEKIDIQDEPSIYTRFFDDSCIGWTENNHYNVVFLKDMQRCANDLLRARGHLLLNDVYDMLGMRRSKAGMVVGWVYNEKNPIGDNYVDFGLINAENFEFIIGHGSKILLNFNVDGNIMDYIK